MRSLSCVTALALPLIATGVSRAQSTASLLVLSKRDHTLAIVDPATLQIKSKVPVGDDPHEVIASVDGTRAYVSNYGFGAFHTLAVIDLMQARALPPVDLGALHGPHGLVVQGGKTWFTAEGAKVLGRYDPASGKVDLVLGTGQNRTHMIWISADGKQIVTTNVNSGTVSIFSQELVRSPAPPPGAALADAAGSKPPAPPPGMTRVDWNQTVVRVGNGSEGFDVSPDGQEIWVANAQDGTVSVVSLSEKKLLETLDVHARGANRLKFTPDGAMALVSAGPSLVIIDRATRSEKARIPVGHGSAGIQMDPDGSRAFVACGPDNSVAVVDLKTLEVTGHIDAGGEPDGMAWAIRPRAAAAR